MKIRLFKILTRQKRMARIWNKTKGLPSRIIKKYFIMKVYNQDLVIMQSVTVRQVLLKDRELFIDFYTFTDREILINSKFQVIY